MWVSFGLLGPASVCQKLCCRVSDTASPVSISISAHLSLLPTNTIRGSFFLWDAEEFVHWGSVSWSNRVCVVVMLIPVNLMCPAIHSALSTFFLFQADCWNVANFLAEVASCIPEATIIWWVLAVTSKTWFSLFPQPEFPLSMQLMFGYVSVVVLEQAAMLWTFLSALSIARAIRLDWSKFNFVYSNKHLQIRSSATPIISKSFNISWIVGPNSQSFVFLRGL